nr:hypothetical protein [Candidatus Woesearchaeota archaeon]
MTVVLISYYLTKNRKGKINTIKDKKWIILERLRFEDGAQKEKCYYVIHKKDKNKKSPCFKEFNNLNEWISENGATKRA